MELLIAGAKIVPAFIAVTGPWVRGYIMSARVSYCGMLARSASSEATGKIIALSRARGFGEITSRIWKKGYRFALL